MIVSGKTCVYKLDLIENSADSQVKNQKKGHRTKYVYQRIEEDLRKSANDHKKKTEHLIKELRGANKILQNMEFDINYIKEHIKDISHHTLISIKTNCKNLREKKVVCQKQIAYLSKESCNNTVKDKEVFRELEKLTLLCEKLDYKEQSMRKQISILEEELSQAVYKLKAPLRRSSDYPVLPMLDRTKLKRSNQLETTKNPLPGPRKLTAVIEVFDRKDYQSEKTTRCSRPQHQTHQKQATRSIPSAHAVTHLFPLIGNQKPLSSRPERRLKHLT